jgi:succinate dehydrogenase hydrophobic anchor subunit
MSSTSYVPGVCNIGPAERRQRQLLGWIGSAITVAALVAFVAFHVPWPWRILIAAPVAMAANGFLQSAMHFCVGFSMAGLYNFGSLGTQESVMDAEMRRADRKKGLQIIGYSMLIAAAVAVIAVLLP